MAPRGLMSAVMLGSLVGSTSSLRLNLVSDAEWTVICSDGAPLSDVGTFTGLIPSHMTLCCVGMHLTDPIPSFIIRNVV